MDPIITKSLKTISLEKAREILAQCAAVIVDGSYVTFPNVLESEDEPGIPSTWLLIGRDEWDDDPLSFRWEADHTVSVTPMGELILCTCRGIEVFVMPLVAQPVETS